LKTLTLYEPIDLDIKRLPGPAYIVDMLRSRLEIFQQLATAAKYIVEAIDPSRRKYNFHAYGWGSTETVSGIFTEYKEVILFLRH